MRDEEGFTILEVMICLAILSGVVVTMLGSLNYHLGLVSYNQNLVTAAVLAREKGEEAALLGIPSLREGSFAEPMGDFSWEIATEETGFEGLRRLDVRVGWGADRSVSFISYLLEGVE
jgi:general secretion pathway protein I